MMLNFGFRKTYGPIGLDIGHESIKMTQLMWAQGTLKLLEAQKIDVPKDNSVLEPGASMIQSIRELLEKGNFQGRDCISCLPNSRLRITSVRIDPADQAKTGASLYKEAAYRFGLDPDKDSIRYIPAGQVRQGNALKQEIILFATDNETIRDHIDMLETAGLVPRGIDPLPCALFRSLHQQSVDQADREHTVVYVDVGCRYTTITFGREGQLCFVKQIAIGTDRFDEVLADKLGVDKLEAHALRLKLQTQRDDYEAACAGNPMTPVCRHQAPEASDSSAVLEHATRQTLRDGIRSVAAELGHELSRCLRYYTVTFRGQRIHRVILCGGGANEGLLLDVLRTQLGCDVHTAETLPGFIGAQLRELRPGEAAHEWVVSLGLALKNMPVADEGHEEATRARPLIAAGQKAGY
jgi:type IV pilus assembly protein PilM